MGKKKKKKLKKAQQVIVIHPPAGPSLLGAALGQIIAAGIAYGVARYAASRPEPPRPGLARFVARHPRAAWDLALWQGGERLKAFGENLREGLRSRAEGNAGPRSASLADQRRHRER